MSMQQNSLSENYRFVEKVLVQGDSRYLNPYLTKILAYFITKKAVSINEREIQKIQEPKENDLHELTNPQKLAKYIAKTLLISEGFLDSEIFFERNFGDSRPDVSALNSNREIFVECFSCRINKVIDYLSQDREVWVLTSGSYPWDKSPLTEKIKLIEFKKGQNWDLIFDEYKAKQNKMLGDIKNPLDNL
jgi:hypothetical protein